MYMAKRTLSRYFFFFFFCLFNLYLRKIVYASLKRAVQKKTANWAVVARYSVCYIGKYVNVYKYVVVQSIQKHLT